MGDARCQENARDLIEGHRREGEGQIRQDDVQGHGNGQGDDVTDSCSSGLKECELGAGKRIQREPGNKEVKGGKGELGEFEGRIGEDGLVGEDLEVRWLVTGHGKWGGGGRFGLTMPIVARVLMTIHIKAPFIDCFAGSALSGCC